MSSFEKLIDLAKRTGDRLIVHDPYSGRDMVIMDVEQYTHLVTGRNTVRDLTGREMVEKINRELAVWRSHHEQEEREELAMVLHEELQDVPAFDPFQDHATDTKEWHQVGDVMQAGFSHIEFPSLALEHESAEDLSNKEESEDDAPITLEESFGLADEPPLALSEEELGGEETQELRYEFPVPEVVPGGYAMEEQKTQFMPRPVPRMAADQEASFQSPKPVIEAPVFFEEPI